MIELLEKKELEVPFIQVNFFTDQQEATSSEDGQEGILSLTNIFPSPETKNKYTLNNDNKFIFVSSASIFKSKDSVNFASISFSVLNEAIDVFFKIVEEGKFITVKLGYIDPNGEQNSQNSIAFEGITDIPSVDCTENGEILLTVRANEAVSIMKVARASRTFVNTKSIKGVTEYIFGKYRDTIQLAENIEYPEDAKQTAGPTSLAKLKLNKQNNITDLDYLKLCYRAIGYDFQVEFPKTGTAIKTPEIKFSKLNKDSNGNITLLKEEDVAVLNWKNSKTNVRSIAFSGKDAAKKGNFLIDENGNPKEVEVYTEDGEEVWIFDEQKMKDFLRVKKSEIGKYDSLIYEALDAAASMSREQRRLTFFKRREDDKGNPIYRKPEEGNESTFGGLGLKASCEFLCGQPSLKINQKVCFDGQVPIRWAKKIKNTLADITFANIKQESLWSITNISHSVSVDGFITELECIK